MRPLKSDLPPTLVSAGRPPLPDYPEAAGNAGLRGSVTVDVTVDEGGKVMSAENARGPYPVCQSVTDPAVMALRNAALEAARMARFQPAEGHTHGSKGRITYTFGSESGTGDAVGGGRGDRMTVIGETDMEPPA